MFRIIITRNYDYVSK